MVQHQTRRLGSIAARLVALSLVVIASMGVISAGPSPGVAAEGEGIGAATGESVHLVSALVVQQEALLVGEEAMVMADALSYRAGPGLDAMVLDFLPYGTWGMIIDGPVTADGYTWYEFSVDGFILNGWVAGEFLGTDDGTAGAGFAIGSEVVVTGDELTFREEPGVSGAVIGHLPIGTPLIVIDGPVVADGYTWYLVQAPADGGQGWVAGEFLATSPGGGATFGLGETVVVNGDELNLRDAPTLDGVVIAHMAIGTEVMITDGPIAADGYVWYQIGVAGTDGVGWVAGEFLAYP